MVLYYHFNNQSDYGENDTRVYDFSNGHLFNGTIYGGMSFNSTGGFMSDGAYEFNNTPNSHINISSNKTFSPYANNNITTFSVLVKLHKDETGEGSTARQYIFAKIATSNFEYRMQRSNFTDGYRISFSIFNLVGSASDDLFLVTNYSMETWYHLVVVLNGTTAIGYVNGALVGTKNLTKPDGFGNASLKIGQASSSQPLNGSVDEFIVWNRTLSASEIFNLYKNYGGCTNFFDGMTISGDTALCPLNYTTSSSGNHILMSSNNVNLDCQGAIISSNYTNATAGVGIHGNGKNNITIQNCIFVNMTTGIWVNGNINSLFTNNTFYVTNQSPLYVRAGINDTITNNTIIGATGNGFGAIHLYTSTNSSFIYNNVINNSGVFYGIYIDGASSFNTIYKNFIFNTSSYSIYQSAGTSLGSTKNSNISNNILKYTWGNSTHGLIIGTNVLNISVIGNEVYYSNWNGIDFASSNSTYLNNYIEGDGHHGFDGYSGAGDNLAEGGFNTFTGNVINNSYYTGFYIRTNKQDSISMNSIINSGNHIGDSAGIAIEGNYSTNFNHVVSSNTISGSMYCIYSGATNITWFNNTLSNCSIADVYVSGFFNDLKIIDNSNFSKNYYSSPSPIFKAINGRLNISITPSVDSESYNFTGGSGGQISLIGFNSLIAYSNRTLYPNTKFILLTNGSSLFLNNFNLTEGVSRQYSPLWFSSSTSTEKHIASNLTDTINATVVINVTSCDIDAIKYTSNSGDYVMTYTDSDWTCLDNQLILSNIIIESTINLKNGNVFIIFKLSLHEPLDLERIIITNFAGSPEIFSFVALILVGVACAYFGMSGRIALVMFGIFTVIMMLYLSWLYVLVIIIAAIAVFYSVKNTVT